VAALVAAWTMEQAAYRAEERDKTSPDQPRLRQGTDFVQRVGRGPLADRLRQQPVTTGTRLSSWPIPWPLTMYRLARLDESLPTRTRPLSGRSRRGAHR
jgi:hypothetical protein